MKIKQQIKNFDSLFSRKIRNSKQYKEQIKSLKKYLRKVKKSTEKGEQREEAYNRLIKTTFSNIMAWIIASNELPISKDFLEMYDRALLISKQIKTPEGRTALAQSMVNPIRRALDYQAIGRKLLMVDELPQGALPRYDKEVKEVTKVIKENKCKKTNTTNTTKK